MKYALRDRRKPEISSLLTVLLLLYDHQHYMTRDSKAREEIGYEA